LEFQATSSHRKVVCLQAQAGTLFRLDEQRAILLVDVSSEKHVAAAVPKLFRRLITKGPAAIEARN
jgi:hypothetical protein